VSTLESADGGSARAAHRLLAVALPALPEVRPGDDLGGMIVAAWQALASREPDLAPAPGDVLVVTQKVVSKAEGAIVDLRTIEPSAFAKSWARQWKKDPRLIELILQQSRRIVRMDHGVLIAETQHGFVTANAGVDQSNTPGDDYATVLPADPDASARKLRAELDCGAVIISDTFGRPWREGLVEVAIGVSGIEALEDLRGTADRSGRMLTATILARADQLAAAAGLVMHKSAGVPVAVIHGVEWQPADGSARPLIRPPETDLFR
jgi:coenzyme F420-0:L-glutamate ligase/coenzyme F420-1:gamma-L-glutamate ligase